MTMPNQSDRHLPGRPCGAGRPARAARAVGRGRDIAAQGDKDGRGGIDLRRSIL